MWLLKVKMGFEKSLQYINCISGEYLLYLSLWISSKLYGSSLNKCILQTFIRVRNEYLAKVWIIEGAVSIVVVSLEDEEYLLINGPVILFLSHS